MIGEIIRLTPNGAVVQTHDRLGTVKFFAHNSHFTNGEPSVGASVEYTPYRLPDRRRIALNVRVLSAEQAEVARCLG